MHRKKVLYLFCLFIYMYIKREICSRKLKVLWKDYNFSLYIFYPVKAFCLEKSLLCIIKGGVAFISYFDWENKTKINYNKIFTTLDCLFIVSSKFICLCSIKQILCENVSNIILHDNKQKYKIMENVYCGACHITLLSCDVVFFFAISLS